MELDCSGWKTPPEKCNIPDQICLRNDEDNFDDSADSLCYLSPISMDENCKYVDICSNSIAETGSTVSCTLSTSSFDQSLWSALQCSLSLTSRSQRHVVEDPWRKLDKKRRLLVNFHHGATCNFDHSSLSEDDESDCCYSQLGRCPTHCRCTAVRRLYDHVTHCSKSGNKDMRTGRCKVPLCGDTRRVWSHYLHCRDPECLICCIIPEATSRDPLTLQKQRPKHESARPPLSPKRTPFKFCEEI